MAQVHKVKEHEVWRTAACKGRASIRMCQYPVNTTAHQHTTGPFPDVNSRVDAVRRLRTAVVGNQYFLPNPRREDIPVQVMVDEPHMVVRRQWPVHAVHTARELGVRRAEGVFPDLVSRERKTAGGALAGLTIWNSGRIKSTEPSAPLSRKTMTRLPLLISSPSVGQSPRRTGLAGGTYARGVIPVPGQ